MALLSVVVVALMLFTLLLLARIRGLEERVARLERARPGGEPYRVAPDLRELSPSPGSEGEDAEVLDALLRGNKIEAIKRYRELTGAGLKSAKDAVEAMERRGAHLENK